MAEKESRQPRGRSRVRTPESSAAPASVRGSSNVDFGPGQPGQNPRDPSQDRRTAQLEYAAALQQQMAPNNIFGAGPPQAAPAQREPNNIFAAGPPQQAPARSRGGPQAPPSAGGDVDRRTAQLEYAADLQ